MFSVFLHTQIWFIQMLTYYNNYNLQMYLGLQNLNHFERPHYLVACNMVKATESFESPESK